MRRLNVKPPKIVVVMLAGAALTLVIAFLVGSLLIGSGILGGSGQTPTLSAADITATFCSVGTSSAGGFVIIYDLWGTPTPTPIILTPTPTVFVRIAGDEGRGAKVFFVDAKCAACHATTDNTEIVGPSLKGISTRAAKKIPGMTAEDYVRNVILDPAKYAVPNTKPGIMPVNFAQTLNIQQVADVVSYVLSLE